jgi:hypothetical protein
VFEPIVAEPEVWTMLSPVSDQRHVEVPSVRRAVWSLLGKIVQTPTFEG